MELDTITMPKAEARAAFLEYRRAVRERHNAEDEMIMRGYRALSQGKQVINLLDVMRAAGEDSEGRPKLAIARADETRIRMRRYATGRVQMGAQLDTRSGKRETRFPADTLPRRALPSTDRNGQRIMSTAEWLSIQATAMVPSVPPQFRPSHALSNYHILWEAEWSRVVPTDPALLKHCGGWLYLVLAVWDLTPLERAVLGLTRN